MIVVNDDYLSIASNINELDDLEITAHTHLGLKKMTSCVISGLNKNNCIVVENNYSVEVSQKREFVRVSTDIPFKILKNGTLFDVTCKNLSGGGVAFASAETLELEDEVTVAFDKKYLDENLKCSAKIIIKKEKQSYVARFLNLSHSQESAIVKYVFKILARHVK